MRKEQREREAKWPRWNVLALTLFELDGHLNDVIRKAREAGAETIAGKAGFWRADLREWRGKIREALNRPREA